MVSAISSPSEAIAFLNSSKAIASRRFLAMQLGPLRSTWRGPGAVLGAIVQARGQDLQPSPGPFPALTPWPILSRPPHHGIAMSQPMNQLSGAEAFVRLLQLHDVKHIFGLCGDTSLPLYDALYRLDHGITHILTRDERSAP